MAMQIATGNWMVRITNSAIGNEQGGHCWPTYLGVFSSDNKLRFYKTVDFQPIHKGFKPLVAGAVGVA